jgi:hypothetical protein
LRQRECASESRHALSSALAILATVSGIASPDGSLDGEIIITTVPKPTVLASASTAGGNFGFYITGRTNANVVIEVCTNLTNPVWIPVTTNLLSSGTNILAMRTGQTIPAVSTASESRNTKFMARWPNLVSSAGG